MFGLEDQKGKKKKGQEFVFELENELKNPVKHREIKNRVERQIQNIKQQLRGGTSEKTNFDTYGLLLHGYTSILKVMARFKK